MPWIVLHREPAPLRSLIQVSWSQASIFCPSQAACSTTPSRSELSSDCPLGSLLSSQHCVLPSRPYLFSLSAVGPFFNNSSLIIIQLLSFVLSDLSGKTPSISIFCVSVPRHQGVTREGNKNTTTRGKFSV